MILILLMIKSLAKMVRIQANLYLRFRLLPMQVIHLPMRMAFNIRMYKVLEEPVLLIWDGGLIFLPPISKPHMTLGIRAKTELFYMRERLLLMEKHYPWGCPIHAIIRKSIQTLLYAIPLVIVLVGG